MFLLIVAVPAIAAAVALVLAIVARHPGPQRDAVVARYPLVLLTWLIAAPFGLFALFGVVVFSQDVSGLDGSGDDAVGSFDPSALLILGFFAALVAAVIVLAHRTARGRGTRPWLLLAVASPGVVTVLIAIVSMALAAWFVGVLGLIIVGGSVTNGIMAVAVHRSRAATSGDTAVPSADEGSTLVPRPPESGEISTDPR